ncbi:MAG TPA: hypothetical protein VM582_05575, partial [Candidatus Thermoplasmatota archaeon]|nr:hypothetical protein [Candidatus Thermoplasmatota archaeon]
AALLAGTSGGASAQEGTFLYPHRDGTLDGRAPTASADAVLTLGGGGPTTHAFASPQLGAPLSLADGASLWLHVRSVAGVGLSVEAALLRGTERVASARASLQPSAAPQDVALAFEPSDAAFAADERVVLSLSIVGATAAAPLSRVDIAYDSTAHPVAMHAARTALAPAAPLAGLLPDSVAEAVAEVPWLMLGLLVLGMLVLVVLATAALTRGAGGARRTMAWGSLVGAPVALAGVGAAALEFGYSDRLGALAGALFATLVGATGASHPGSRGLAAAVRERLARLQPGEAARASSELDEPPRRVPVEAPAEPPWRPQPPDDEELERALRRWRIEERARP